LRKERLRGEDGGDAANFAVLLVGDADAAVTRGGVAGGEEEALVVVATARVGFGAGTRTACSELLSKVEGVSPWPRCVPVKVCASSEFATDERPPAFKVAWVPGVLSTCW